MISLKGSGQGRFCTEADGGWLQHQIWLTDVSQGIVGKASLYTSCTSTDAMALQSLQGLIFHICDVPVSRDHGCGWLRA